MKQQICAILIFSLFSIAFAGTYYVSPTGSDTNSGTQTSPWKTFNKAVSTASSGSTIYAYPGMYSGSGNTGISVDDDISIISLNGPKQTFVSGPGSWYIRSSCSITGIQFINFATLFDLYSFGDYLSFSLTNVIMWNNDLALNIDDSQISVNLNSCNFTDNNVAVYHGQNEGYNGHLSISNTNFTRGERAVLGYFQSIDVSDSLFQNIECVYAGCALCVNSTSEFTMNNTVFASVSSTSNGSALYLSSTSYDVVIDNSYFSKNSAVNGGAIYTYATVTISNSEFEGNEAQFGGAVYLSGQVGSSVGATIENTKFSDNTAVNSGGAFYCTGSSIFLSGVELISNESPNGSSYSCSSSCSVFTYDITSYDNNASCGSNF